MLAKRPISGNDTMPSKRVRQVEMGRLCDLRGASDLMTNKVNASKARERGYIRSRDASGKYEEVWVP